jgi:hypothetical protein
MMLTFLGTRANIHAITRRYRRHSVLLVEHHSRRVMIDCGHDWLHRVELVWPDAIVVTHAHPYHPWGLKQGAHCPVYATAASWTLMADYPIDTRHTASPRVPFDIAGISFEAFPVDNSLRAPAVGYHISAGRRALIYVPDLVAIVDRSAALRGIALYVSDGVTMKRPPRDRGRGSCSANRDIGRRIGPDLAGLEPAAAAQDDSDLVGRFDNVVVGDHIAPPWIDNHPGSGGPALSLLRRRLLGDAEEAPEEGIRQQRVLLDRDAAVHRDADDAGKNVLKHRRKTGQLALCGDGRHAGSRGLGACKGQEQGRLGYYQGAHLGLPFRNVATANSRCHKNAYRASPSIDSDQVDWPFAVTLAPGRRSDPVPLRRRHRAPAGVDTPGKLYDHAFDPEMENLYLHPGLLPHVPRGAATGSRPSDLHQCWDRSGSRKFGHGRDFDLRIPRAGGRSDASKEVLQ